jgi:hypothetical protein
VGMAEGAVVVAVVAVTATSKKSRRNPFGVAQSPKKPSTGHLFYTLRRFHVKQKRLCRNRGRATAEAVGCGDAASLHRT